MAEVTRTAEVDPIPLSDLAELGTTTRRAVSIFMPTARAGAEVRENAIRAKALIKDAESQLTANGASEEETAQILGPLVTLLEDTEYWQYLADGLALYAADGIWRAYRVTTDFPEISHVSDRFAIRPIIPAAVGDGEFLVLAVSQNKVTLYEATRATIREIDLGSITGSVDEMAGETSPPSHHQQRFAAGAGAGSVSRSVGTGIVHSHGTGAEVGDIQLEKFLRQVAQGLDERLEPNDKRPVVLAAVQEYHSPLREFLSYDRLADDVVAGNPDATAPGDLLESAWGIVEPILLARAEADAERFGDAIGAGRAISGGGTDILRHAQEGRVDTVLLARRRCAADHGPDDLDAAIGQTLATSGSVVVVETLPKDVAEG